MCHIERAFLHTGLAPLNPLKETFIPGTVISSAMSWIDSQASVCIGRDDSPCIILSPSLFHLLSPFLLFCVSFSASLSFCLFVFILISLPHLLFAFLSHLLSPSQLDLVSSILSHFLSPFLLLCLLFCFFLFLSLFFFSFLYLISFLLFFISSTLSLPTLSRFILSHPLSPFLAFCPISFFLLCFISSLSISFAFSLSISSLFFYLFFFCLVFQRSASSFSVSSPLSLSVSSFFSLSASSLLYPPSPPHFSFFIVVFISISSSLFLFVFFRSDYASLHNYQTLRHRKVNTILHYPTIGRTSLT